MEQTDYMSWHDRMAVTEPIKNIMNCVDALEDSYEQRLAAMKAEYQKDVEAILDCYKEETEGFKRLGEQQAELLEQMYQKLEDAQKLYKKEHVEHKITKECLANTRKELESLSNSLKTEQEMLALTQKRIETANNQIKIALETKPVLKTRNLFMQIFERHKSRSAKLNKPDAKPVSF